MPRYKKVWGYKRQVYVDLTPKKWVDHDVKVLHDAMSGLGTDEAELIRTLANRTSAQIAEISKAFSEKYGAKGDLIKWIKGVHRRHTLARPTDGPLTVGAPILAAPTVQTTRRLTWSAFSWRWPGTRPTPTPWPCTRP